MSVAFKIRLTELMRCLFKHACFGFERLAGGYVVDTAYAQLPEHTTLKSCWLEIKM